MADNERGTQERDETFYFTVFGSLVFLLSVLNNTLKEEHSLLTYL